VHANLSARVQPFFLVLARDRTHVRDKIDELAALGVSSFLIICGERVNHPKVLYRKAVGKWDAINFGSQFIPSNAQLIVLNDVDTTIHSLDQALKRSYETDLIYCGVEVAEGPQRKFYKILDRVRRRLPVAASGELMLINRRVFSHLVPIPPCTAEDTFLMFRALELGYRVEFCPEAYVTTSRTRSPAEERAYKARTLLGVYQVLNFAKPPPAVRAFYMFLPLIAPLLAIGGSAGRSWTIGIEQATTNHLMKRYATKF
jgi:GT2 family glycosyltransferase